MGVTVGQGAVSLVWGCVEPQVAGLVVKLGLERPGHVKWWRLRDFVLKIVLSVFLDLKLFMRKEMKFLNDLLEVKAHGFEGLWSWDRPDENKSNVVYLSLTNSKQNRKFDKILNGWLVLMGRNKYNSNINVFGVLNV